MSKQHVVATIYDKKGNVLSVGRNSYTKSHPQQAKFARAVGQERKIYLHAEIDAICRATKSGKVLYHIHVERRLKDGREANALPCPICREAIARTTIKKVTYTV